MHWSYDSLCGRGNPVYIAGVGALSNYTLSLVELEEAGGVLARPMDGLTVGMEPWHASTSWVRKFKLNLESGKEGVEFRLVRRGQFGEELCLDVVDDAVVIRECESPVSTPVANWWFRDSNSSVAGTFRLQSTLGGGCLQVQGDLLRAPFEWGCDKGAVFRLRCARRGNGWGVGV